MSKGLKKRKQKNFGFCLVYSNFLYYICIMSTTNTTPAVHCYNFNFIGGGWNFIHASSLAEAVTLAQAKYANDDKCNPNPDSFRIATQADTDSLMSMFY